LDAGADGPSCGFVVFPLGFGPGTPFAGAVLDESPFVIAAGMGGVEAPDSFAFTVAALLAAFSALARAFFWAGVSSCGGVGVDCPLVVGGGWAGFSAGAFASAMLMVLLTCSRKSTL